MNSLESNLAKWRESGRINAIVADTIASVHEELFSAPGKHGFDKELRLAYDQGVTDMALTLARRLAELLEDN